MFGQCRAPSDDSAPSKPSSHAPALPSTLGKRPHSSSVNVATTRPPGSVTVTFAGSTLSSASATIFDPHASIAGNATSTVGTKWFTPLELAPENPCPTSSAPEGPALRAALALLAAKKQASASTSLRFSRDVLLDQSMAPARLILAFAPWGAFRLENSAQLISNKTNAIHPAGCLNIPGNTGLAFGQAVLPALEKGNSNQALTTFKMWVKHQCMDAQFAGYSRPNMPFRPCFLGHQHQPHPVVNLLQTRAVLSIQRRLQRRFSDPVHVLAAIGTQLSRGHTSSSVQWIDVSPSDQAAAQHLLCLPFDQSRHRTVPNCWISPQSFLAFFAVGWSTHVAGATVTQS